MSWFTKDNSSSCLETLTFTLKSILLWTMSYMVTLGVGVLKHVCRCFDTLTIKKSTFLPLEKWVGFCDRLMNSV